MAETRKTTIYGGRVITPHAVLDPGYVVLQGQTILDVGAGTPPASGGTEVDAKGLWISPGLIDLHVNGAGGSDTLDGSLEAIHAIAQANAATGTTGILPTAITAPKDSICTALGLVADCVEQGNPGAEVLGSHLEGPFINETKKGVHLAENVRKPELETFQAFVAASRKTLRIITLAPELAGAVDLVKAAKREGIIASAGHTSATYDELMGAFRAGVDYVAHVYNAMSAFTSREPGSVGAVFDSPSIWAEIIADGLHVHPRSIVSLLRQHGLERTLLVTDAVRPAGTDMTEFEMAGIKAQVRDGGSYTPEGALCGSVLTMNVAVRNIVKWTNYPVSEVVRMASLNPARVLGLEHKKGSLAIGKAADVVVFDDEFNARHVWVNGSKFF